MRTARDRFRHAGLFELLGLALVMPIGALLFELPMDHFGIVALVSTTIAMAWNYAFNLGFDYTMLRLTGMVQKTFPLRMLHAVLFEVGLLSLLVPFIAWYLGVPLWQALIMDLALAGFYIVYAFAFNWLYDVVFPVPVDDVSNPGPGRCRLECSKRRG